MGLFQRVRDRIVDAVDQAGGEEYDVAVARQVRSCTRGALAGGADHGLVLVAGREQRGHVLAQLPRRSRQNLHLLDGTRPRHEETRLLRAHDAAEPAHDDLAVGRDLAHAARQPRKARAAPRSRTWRGTQAQPTVRSDRAAARAAARPERYGARSPSRLANDRARPSRPSRGLRGGHVFAGTLEPFWGADVFVGAAGFAAADAGAGAGALADFVTPGGPSTRTRNGAASVRMMMLVLRLTT